MLSQIRILIGKIRFWQEDEVDVLEKEGEVTVACVLVGNSEKVEMWRILWQSRV